MKDTDFCTVCRYYLYLEEVHPTKEESEKGATSELRRVCRNCGYYKKMEGGLILEIDLKEKTSEGYKILMNEFTKNDPTLPHIHNLRCPNQTCTSNKGRVYPVIADKPVRMSMSSDEADEKGSPAAAVTAPIPEIVEYSEEPDKPIELGISPATAAAAAAQPSSINGGAGPDDVESDDDKGEVESDVIYLKYDAINMKYLYICNVCGAKWRSKA
jgi:DNA-directed RNA polymerase subunit M/transcription elongation factor TFIIS